MLNNEKSINKRNLLIFDLILAVVLLALDQYTKYLAVVRLKGKEAFVLIESVLEFDYLENRGSAFGMLQNQKVFLITVGFVFMSIILYVLLKIPAKAKYTVMHALLSFIMAGGIGNMIDRIRFDFVIDFISFVLIDFPIFNVADCFIVVGTILLFLLFVFGYKDSDLEFLNLRSKKESSDSEDSKG